MIPNGIHKQLGFTGDYVLEKWFKAGYPIKMELRCPFGVLTDAAYMAIAEFGITATLLSQNERGSIYELFVQPPLEKFNGSN